MRPGLAPSAVRIPTSRARALARAKRRLATLTVAINSTRPTADSSARSTGRVRPKMRSDNGWSSKRTPALVSG